jgi:predicted DCC family thiol-disulfide oxidoreductase YuxK
MTDSTKPMKVYYNSACPVCKAGIETQQGQIENCAVLWQDVHADNALADEIAGNLEFIRERLHVVNAEGKLLVGFDALLELGRNSPKQRWLARFFSLPGLRQLGILAYNLFAAMLYRWNKFYKHW